MQSPSNQLDRFSTLNRHSIRRTAGAAHRRVRRARHRLRHQVRSVCGLLLFGGLLATAVWATSRIGTPVRGFPSPGDKPEGLAFDGRYLWCNNFTDGSLYKVDPVDGHVVAHYQGAGLPSAPEGLAWDGEHVWSCHWRTGFIFKMRETAEGMEIVQTFTKPAGSGNSVGLGWDGSHLWLTCWPSASYEFGQIYQLDPNDGTVITMHELPVYWIEDLAWDGTYFWSCEWGRGVGFAIDTATGDTLNSYTTPGAWPVGAAWDGTHLWITDTQKDSIWAVDILGAQTSVHTLDWSRLKQLFIQR
jgi:glutamine cyclotransferase